MSENKRRKGNGVQTETGASLREKEAMYRDLYDNAPDMFVSVDAVTAKVRECNQTVATALGYTKQEILGRPIFDLYHPDCMEGVRKAFHSFQTTGEVHNAELQLKRKNGTKIAVSLNVSSSRDEQGNVLYSRSIWRDITEQKRAEEAHTQLLREMVQANEALETFSALASHDLRAPLRTINSFTHFLLKDYAADLPAEAQEYLSLIQKGVQQMDRLIQDLLSFSRLHHQPLQKEPVSMTALVRTTLEALRGEQEGRHVEIRVGDLPVCHADPALLRQVWINLIGNALKYTRTRESALIEVGFRSESPDSAPVFFVKDNGIGFDLKYANQIFNPFKRLHASSEYEGTGIGLAIVQRVIEYHGGRVWAEAQTDAGATFFFTLGNSTSTRTDATDR